MAPPKTKTSASPVPKEPVHPPPEPVVEEPEALHDAEPEEPEPKSMILKRLGWDVFKLPITKQTYYYSAARREVRVQPPYFEILGLDESKFCTTTKEHIWKAFFERKNEYKVKEGGALAEELIDPDSAVDWTLIMEALHVLCSQEARAEHELRNLMPHAQLQLRGLRIQHEARAREAARAEADARALGYGSVSEMRAARAAAAKAAAEAAEREAEEEAKRNARKKR